MRRLLYRVYQALLHERLTIREQNCTDCHIYARINSGQSAMRSDDDSVAPSEMLDLGRANPPHIQTFAVV